MKMSTKQPVANEVAAEVQGADNADSGGVMTVAGEPDASMCAVPARFAEIVRTVPPDHLAYVGTDGVMTYAELDRQSDRLASALLAALGQPGAQKAVAVLLPHAAATLVGMLGVLKTGHFFVPLAPEQGINPHIQIVADCPPAAWVTTAALAAHSQAVLATLPATPLLLLDELPPASTAAAVGGEISPQANAMVAFTSGTTGRPRGVQCTHAQLLAIAATYSHHTYLNQHSRVAHLHSYAFFSALTPIFSALLNGATVCTLSLREGTLPALYQFLVDERVTHVGVTVSTWRGLAEASASFPPLTALRVASTGGETVSHQDVASIARILPPDGRIVCILGSTEAFIYACFEVDATAPLPGDRVPAGYAPKSVQVMILDADRQPVAAGVEGEIAVRGRYLTPGYWNSPELNATRFLPDPDGGDRRIFLTGDRGRLAPDGLLEHLGRVDFMVKVRGYRIEPTSIELALLAHPNLSEGVVVARPSRDGGNQLVAYLVARQSPAPTVSELRRWLAQTLPDYMIPARFVFLAQLPRNVNRKVDRPALPPPGATRPDVETPFVAPRNALEYQLAGIWAEVLGLDEVGMDDNFLELGGDSLNALRMMLEVEKQLERSAPLAFFHAPTLTHLVELLQPEERAPSPLPAIEAQSAPTETKPSLLNRLGTVALFRGPTYGSRALPYAAGMRLQRLWLSSPVVRRRFTAQEQLVQRWSELAGVPDANAAFHTSLLTNTWTAWRLQALTKPLGASPWVTVQGDATLWQAQAQPQGRIYLVMHTPLAHLFYRGLIAGGVKAQPISGRPGELEMREYDRAAQVYQAYQALLRGEAVIIAGDGGKGRQHVVVPFFGGERPFLQGGAELAVQTGAALTPVFCTLATSGHVTIEVCPPLARGDGAAQAQIERLTRAYADLVVARWPHVCASLEWDNLARWLARTQPHADGG